MHGSADTLVGPLLVAGCGQGLIAAPIISTVLAHSSEDVAGASGALLTATQVANILSVAVTGGIFDTILGTRTGHAAYNTASAGALVRLCALSALTGLSLAALSHVRRREAA